MTDEEFDDLVMTAKDLGIGDWTTAEKSDSLAQRLRRLIDRKRKSEGEGNAANTEAAAGAGGAAAGSGGGGEPTAPKT